MTFLRKNYVIILFFIIIFVSIFFRFWKLNSIPFGLNNDAAWEGSAALEMLRGDLGTYLPYAAEGWRGEGITRVFTAIFMIFLGPSPVTIRLATNIFGIGLIISMFFLVRRLFNDKLALLTSFFIAISGWHITFSKSGWRAITVPFLASLLFYFYFKGLETKKNLNFIIAGIMLALVSLYTYDAARAVPIFFLFWLTFEIISKRTFLKTYYRNLIVLFTSAFIVALPMLLYAHTNWENFTSRSGYLFVGNEISKVGNLTPLMNNLTTSLTLFNVSGNGNDFFIFEPLVDSPVSWLLPIGLIITLYFIFIKRNKKFFFVLTWLLFSLMPGILSVPNGNRAIGAIPAVYFLAAVGIFYPIKFLLNKINNKTLKHIIYILIFLFCLSATNSTYHDYLGPDRRELAGFYPETLVTTNYIKTIWNDYAIVLTDNYPRELLTYYLYHPGSSAFSENYIWLQSSDLFITQNNNRQTAFFMFANDENKAVARQLMKKFPKSKMFYLWYTNDNINRPASLVVLTE